MGIGDYTDAIQNFSSLSQIEQVKLVSYFYCVVKGESEFTPTQIRACFEQENLKVPTNVAQYFPMLTSSKNPILVRKGAFYNFHRTAKKNLDEVYLGNKHSATISSTLRGLLPKLTSSEQQSFLEEVVSCFEIKCFRAAILMCWLLTMDAIYECVLDKYLLDFNQAIQSNGKYKRVVIKNKEDFTEIKEADFIILLNGAKIFTSDIRKILEEKLNFRNTAAHPNIIVIKESKAISFIEDLVENVITKIN